MKRQLYLFAILAGLITGCSKENELKKSIMIYDEEFTDLPAYTEWGYNTFGAYYDRDVFISDDATVPVKVIITDSIFSFQLHGHKGSGYYYYGDEMSMNFGISGFLPEDYSGLTALNDTIFDLTDQSINVSIEDQGAPKDTISILSGKLYFKRAQNLLVDTKQVEVILSGYFDFKALIDGEPVTISNGRFDVGIGPDNFYKF